MCQKYPKNFKVKFKTIDFLIGYKNNISYPCQKLMLLLASKSNNSLTAMEELHLLTVMLLGAVPAKQLPHTFMNNQGKEFQSSKLTLTNQKSFQKHTKFKQCLLSLLYIKLGTMLSKQLLEEEKLTLIEPLQKFNPSNENDHVSTKIV